MDDARFFPSAECGAQLLATLGQNGYRLDTYSETRHGYYFVLESTVAKAQRAQLLQQQGALIAQLQAAQAPVQQAAAENGKPDIHVVQPEVPS